jgi:hypothetical protein
MWNLWKNRCSRHASLVLLVLLVFVKSNAFTQLCADPSNIIYGINNNGLIYPINVNTGAVGTPVNPPYTGNAPELANGLAFNQLNGKFYYFKRLPNTPPTEFMSFDPATNAYEMLSSPVTTQSVFSGSITNDGSGYYCWDHNGKLFYYKIAANTWTAITGNIKDQYGKDVDSILRANPSGDGAIDGAGNLWILPSSGLKYGLYKIKEPLPTSPVSSLVVEEFVPLTKPPSQFTGIAFTPTGEIFMSGWNNAIYRLEDDQRLTYMSAMSLDMADLTSCNFPLAVLASANINFFTKVQHETVKLSWSPLPGNNAVNYIVERSTDNKNWKAISRNDIAISSRDISFVDVSPFKGKNFYRIKIVGGGNFKKYSVVRMADVGNRNDLELWPNPVHNELFIQNNGAPSSVVIYDFAGNRVKVVRIGSGVNHIDFAALPPGKYFLVVTLPDNRRRNYNIIKN